ncbi:MAG: hypothetical protein IJI57_11885 [Flexilinea sp.]|nr:hypothetical protein [Flexilinea sp.]
MSIKEANIELISVLPDEDQEKIFRFLQDIFSDDNPFKPMSEKEILAALAESRECYARGEYQDFDEALDEIMLENGL